MKASANSWEGTRAQRPCGVSEGVQVGVWGLAGSWASWTCCKYVKWSGSKASVCVSKGETTGRPGYGRD